MRSKYLRQQEFFDTHAKQGDSIVWKNILKCKDLLRQGLIWTVGDGEDILFWHDNWVTNENLVSLLKLEVQDLTDSNIKVSAFIENNCWNIPKLSQQIRDQAIIRRITGIPLPISQIKDSFHWGLSSTGCFTTKSAIWSSHALVPEEEHWPYKWVWSVDTMPKIKIFL